MTKFGRYLEETQEPEWRVHYVRYKLLKQILNEIVSRHELQQSGGGTGNGGVAFTPPKHLTHLSLTFAEVRPGSDKSGAPAVTESSFFEALDKDMDKVRTFVEASLAGLRARVEQLDADVEEAERWGARDHTPPHNYNCLGVPTWR
jgi:SPX domain protein involved in polyphosphate accumulation